MFFLHKRKQMELLKKMFIYFFLGFYGFELRNFSVRFLLWFVLQFTYISPNSFCNFRPAAVASRCDLISLICERTENILNVNRASLVRRPSINHSVSFCHTHAA